MLRCVWIGITVRCCARITCIPTSWWSFQLQYFQRSSNGRSHFYRRPHTLHSLGCPRCYWLGILGLTVARLVTTHVWWRRLYTRISSYVWSALRKLNWRLFLAWTTRPSPQKTSEGLLNWPTTSSAGSYKTSVYILAATLCVLRSLFCRLWSFTRYWALITNYRPSPI